MSEVQDGIPKEEHPSDNKDAASGLWFSASPTPPKKPRQTKSNDLAGVWLCSMPTGDASTRRAAVLSCASSSPAQTLPGSGWDAVPVS
jgi:hypothetical protein